jgi:sirohydrochlorin cobaltochelatase
MPSALHPDARTALVLFAHGARDPEWARPLERLEARIRVLAPGQPVRRAFLEFMSPSLPVAVGALCAEGHTHITVLPVFLAQGGHLKNDIPVLMAALSKAHPECTLTLRPPVGEAQDVIDAMALHALSTVPSAHRLPVVRPAL